MSAIRSESIADRSAWRGRELEHRADWTYTLTDQHLEELDSALAQVRDCPLTHFNVDAFRGPGLTALMNSIGGELQHGLGFSLLRGFPVENYSITELENLYWGLCTHLGNAVTQNGQAGLIHYVTDGALRPSQGNRGVGKPKESRLHVDLADCVSLLCVRQAPDDPPSRVASSMHVHNEILRDRPGDLARLYKGFQWDRQGEHAAHETATTGYRVPLFSQRDSVVSCRYNRGWIAPAAQRLGVPLSGAELELLDFIDEIAVRDCLEFPFQPGDVQFCNNYTVLHGRAAHAPVPEEERKRVLLRIWLDFPESRPLVDEGLIRYGIIRHGALGWTVEDLLANRHRDPRPRTAQGIPAL